MILTSQQKAEVAAMSENEGYKALLSLAEAELTNKIKMLTDPCKPYEQKLEAITALQGEIRGMRWWINQVNTVLKGKDDN